MRILTVLLVLQILITSALGQDRSGSISGDIKDPGGKPLDAVSVSLLKIDDSSTTKMATTDGSGRFSMEHVAPGKYRLSVSHVGYASWMSQPLEITLTRRSLAVQTIILQASDASLSLVTVVGRRPLIENKMDKTVVNVDASPTNGGLTALEVLEKSPGVMVDNDGNVSLKGKNGVVIMIDGKPTYLSAQDLANYLKNMPASQLDQIEIMSQPPAKYDASGNSGVINLITKRNKNNGFNASLTLTAIIARYFKSPNSFNFNWRQGSFNIYGNYGYAWWDGFNDIHANSSLRENAQTPFDRYTSQHTYGRYSDRGQSFRAGVDYFANKNTTIGFSVNGTVDKEWFTSGSTTYFYDSLHNYVQYNLANSLNKTPQTHLGFNGNLTRKLDTKGSELSVDADYIFYNTKGILTSDNYLYNADGYPSDAPYLLDGLLPSKIDIYSIKGDYKKVVSNDITFEAGIKSSYVQTDNNAIYSLYNDTLQSWQPDTNISNHFIYKENINAAYLNLQQKFGKLSMQLGLRAEQTNTNGNQTVKSVDFEQHYIQLFPTAYFTYKTDDNNTFGISYGRRIQRPSYQSLNPFRFQLDRYTYEQGNPNLQPQFSNNVELSYNYKGELNVSANYTMTTDIISDAIITFKQPGDSNYTIYQTSQNIASQRNIGLSINYSKQMTKSWTLNAFLNVYNNHYRGVVDSTDIDVGFTSFNASFNTQYSFKKGWMGELSGFYYAKDYISGVLLADGRGMFSLGGSKKVFNGKGTVKLNFRDPLYLMSFNAHSDLDKGLTNTHSIWDNRRIIFTLVYRFGKTAGGQVQRRGSGATDEQSRVGGGNGQQ
ncbi:MAG TPA: TonB-dependent receptor [Puia sp.]|jgi:outer membrane receptor protein involved in Fe transport|nr:TonB-dependent receptor [Puia sp.]